MRISGKLPILYSSLNAHYPAIIMKCVRGALRLELARLPHLFLYANICIHLHKYVYKGLSTTYDLPSSGFRLSKRCRNGLPTSPCPEPRRGFLKIRVPWLHGNTQGTTLVPPQDDMGGCQNYGPFLVYPRY